VKDSKTYTIANRNDTDRVVMVEHPNRTDFTLTSKDKPWETAADVHRFKVTAPAGKTTKYTVSEEKDFGSSVQITNSDDQSIRILINQTVTSDKVKKALDQAMTLRGKLSATQREIQQQERQLNIITTDQDRLRKNLKEMPPEAAAYKRYLKKFDDQETEIERLQKLIKELQDGEHAQRKDYENFLANLSVE
jgi:septal ring factor EnvC (AmiA/AmiB activator)